MHQTKSIYTYDVLLLLCIVLELLSSIYVKTLFPHQVNSGIFFTSGILFGVLLLAKYYRRTLSVHTETPVISAVWRRTGLSLSIVALVAIGLLLPQTAAVFRKIPIDVAISDVIPTVQELCQRYLNGSFVYEPIEKFGYHLPVTYLPMQWMPYLIAEKGHFDYRWIAIGIWIMASVVLIIRAFRAQNIIVRLLTPVLVSLCYYLICYHHEGLIGTIIELMVAGYYMLLISSLNSKYAVFRGLMIGICLMSRYSLLLWLPLAAIIVFINESRRAFWMTAGTTLLFVLLIYIIPFLSKDWPSFYNGYKYYDTSALGEWQHINPSNGKPYHLYSGHGIAYKFYEWTQVPLTTRIKWLQKAHLFASLGITALLGLWYWARHKQIDYRIFLLGSFKIYLSVFLFFIQVPYMYLMIVSLFVSIAIFAEQGRYRIVRPAQS